MDTSRSSEELDAAARSALVAGMHAGHLGHHPSDNPYRSVAESLLSHCLAFHWAEGFGAGRRGHWLYPDPLWSDWTYILFLNVIDLCEGP